MRQGMPGAGAPPFRAKPKMPPKMADGGFGAPEPLGGMAKAMPRAAAPPPAMDDPGMTDPDMDGDTDSPVIRPEALNYHDELHQCSGCQHFSDGQCNVLKMEVSPEGGCNAYEAGQSEDPDLDEDMAPADAGDEEEEY